MMVAPTSLLITQAVGAQLRAVPNNLQRQRIVAAIKEFGAENTLNVDRQLLPSGLRRARVGDWRILYIVSLNKVTVLTIKSDHRTVAYA